MLDNILAAIFFIGLGLAVILYTKFKYTKEFHETQVEEYREMNKGRFTFSWLFVFMSKTYILAKIIIYGTGLVCIAFGLLAVFTI